MGKTVTTAGRAREVIGVVKTGKYTTLGESPTEFMYLPHREGMTYDMTLVARTAPWRAASVEPVTALKTE